MGKFFFDFLDPIKQAPALRSFNSLLKLACIKGLLEIVLSKILKNQGDKATIVRGVYFKTLGYEQNFLELDQLKSKFKKDFFST